MFRGRQITHSELGLEVLKRVQEDLSDIGKVESPPSFEGRVMFMVMAPLKDHLENQREALRGLSWGEAFRSPLQVDGGCPQRSSLCQR